MDDKLSAEIFSPPYLFKGSRPVITSAPSLLAYNSTFSVVTPDATRIASISLLPLGSVTHHFNVTQRYLSLPFRLLQAGSAFSLLPMRISRLRVTTCCSSSIPMASHRWRRS